MEREEQVHLHHGIWHLNPNLKQRREWRGKRSSWTGKEKKSWYPSITDGLRNARYPSLGEEMWPTSRAAMPNGNRGPGGNTASSFFFWMIDQDTWEPGTSDAGGCWLGRVSGRRDQWEDQKLCLIAQGCRALLSALRDHCALGWTVLLTFLTHISWGTTAPPYLKQYHGHIPSTARIAWDAFMSWQNGRFPFFPGRPSCLVKTCGRTASFHVPTLSLSLRGTLMHPQRKASSFGVVWVSKFPSLFSIAATQMFTLWRPSWSFTFESCQSLSSPLPNMKTFFLVDSYSQKMRERSVIFLICIPSTSKVVPKTQCSTAFFSSLFSPDLNQWSSWEPSLEFSGSRELGVNITGSCLKQELFRTQSCSLLLLSYEERCSVA